MQRFDDAQDIRIVDGGYWRVRMDTGELARNRQRFHIDPAEYALAEQIVFEILAKVVNHDLLPDVERVRSTQCAWRRYSVDTLRIVYETKYQKVPYVKDEREPVLIWHMLLRKNYRERNPDWIYDLVAQRQREVYRVKPRDRKGRLVKD